MYGTNYIRGNSGNEEKMPIRWMAPESIETHLYNESTDVVSCVNPDYNKNEPIYTIYTYSCPICMSFDLNFVVTHTQ